MTASTVPDRRAECTRFGCASTRSPTAASIFPALRRVPIREKDPRWNIGGLPKPIGGRDAPRHGLPKAVGGGRNGPVVGDFIACGDRINHHDRRSARLTVSRVGRPVYGDSSVGGAGCAPCGSPGPIDVLGRMARRRTQPWGKGLDRFRPYGRPPPRVDVGTSRYTDRGDATTPETRD